MLTSHNIMCASSAYARLQRELQRFKGTRQEWYWQVYLQSEHWKWLREEKLQSAPQCCFHCKAQSNLDIHHLQYRSFYDVQLCDLQIVCRDCHERIHANREPRKRSVPLQVRVKDWYAKKERAKARKERRRAKWKRRTIKETTAQRKQRIENYAHLHGRGRL